MTRTALQNAASVASLLLTTEAAVCELPEDKPAQGGMPGGDMGGMGGMGGMGFYAQASQKPGLRPGVPERQKSRPRSGFFLAAPT